VVSIAPHRSSEQAPSHTTETIHLVTSTLYWLDHSPVTCTWRNFKSLTSPKCIWWPGLRSARWATKRVPTHAIYTPQQLLDNVLACNSDETHKTSFLHKQCIHTHSCVKSFPRFIPVFKIQREMQIFC